jgi:hypothetical protein
VISNYPSSLPEEIDEDSAMKLKGHEHTANRVPYRNHQKL